MDLFNSFLENPAYFAVGAILFTLGLRLIAYANSSKTNLVYGLISLPKSRSKAAKRSRVYLRYSGFGLLVAALSCVYFSIASPNNKGENFELKYGAYLSEDGVQTIFNELTVLPYSCQPSKLKLDYHVLLEGVYNEKEKAEQRALALKSLGMAKAVCRHFNCPEIPEYHGKYIVTVERFCRSLKSLSEKKKQCEAIAKNNGIKIEFKPKKIALID